MSFLVRLKALHQNQLPIHRDTEKRNQGQNLKQLGVSALPSLVVQRPGMATGVRNAVAVQGHGRSRVRLRNVQLYAVAVLGEGPVIRLALLLELKRLVGIQLELVARVCEFT